MKVFTFISTFIFILLSYSFIVSAGSESFGYGRTPGITGGNITQIFNQINQTINITNNITTYVNASEVNLTQSNNMHIIYIV
jgi:hypothetical protein